VEQEQPKEVPPHFRLPEHFKEQLLSTFNTANELLRHFWSSYPITTDHLAQKVERVIESILALLNRAQTWQQNLEKEYADLLSPLLDSLNQAIVKYKTEGSHIQNL